MPSWPRAISTMKAPSTTTSVVIPANWVAEASMALIRSSRRSSSPATVSLRVPMSQKAPPVTTIRSSPKTPNSRLSPRTPATR
jgi:hypothetical protein